MPSDAGETIFRDFVPCFPLMIVGYIFVVATCLFFGFKVIVAFDTKGGDGGVPLMDGVMFPPVLLLAGLSFLGTHWNWWVWGLAWLFLTLTAFGIMEVVSRFAERRR